MKLYHILSSLIFFILFSACDQTTKRNSMSNLADADSIAVMYYNTPNNPRFFKYVKEYDIQKLETVINDANGKVIAERNDCATEGKIYFYGKKGAIDILYFSIEDTCMTFSFIITGEKHYVKMSKKSKEFLTSIQTLAKEPISIQ